MRLSEKWDGRIPGVATAPGDWKERARRAEAEASAARTLRAAAEMRSDARAQELQRELETVTTSSSWRLTAPLRWLKARRASR